LIEGATYLPRSEDKIVAAIQNTELFHTVYTPMQAEQALIAAGIPNAASDLPLRERLKALGPFMVVKFTSVARGGSDFEFTLTAIDPTDGARLFFARRRATVWWTFAEMYNPLIDADVTP
jgi:hypothetical protein